jgi:serine/threonine protein kinase
MNSICSPITKDFLHKSTKITTLGEGTFGSVALYDTPRGHLVVKETKMQHKSLGYPPDFLNEVDILIKLGPIKSVVDIEGVCFDNDDRKGYLFMEPMKWNLWEWAGKTSFNKRMRSIRSLISTIGGALGVMHHYSLVHNDIKTNNILVSESSEGPIFKLADFGKSFPVNNPNVRYCGIEKYHPPSRQDVYHSEIWAFMVVLVEVILGGERMVNMKCRQHHRIDKYGEKIADQKCAKCFYRKYAMMMQNGKDRFELRDYLHNHLHDYEYNTIPDDFWDFVKPIYRGYDTTMTQLLRGIGISLNTNVIQEVNSIISKEVPIQPNYHLVEEKVRRKFRSHEMNQYYPKFIQLYNKFLSLVTQKLQPIDLQYYAEVAFVIIGQKRAKRFEYFPDQDSFLSFQRAFLMTIGYQINIL